MKIKARTAKGVLRFRRAGHRFDFRIREYEVTEEEFARIEAESMIDIQPEEAVVHIDPDPEPEPKVEDNEDEEPEVDPQLVAEKEAQDRELERNMNTERKAAAREELEGDDQSDDQGDEELTDLTKAELQELAREAGINPKQNKAELVAALEASDAAIEASE